MTTGRLLIHNSLRTSTVNWFDHLGLLWVVPLGMLAGWISMMVLTVLIIDRPPTGSQVTVIIRAFIVSVLSVPIFGIFFLLFGSSSAVGCLVLLTLVTAQFGILFLWCRNEYGNRASRDQLNQKQEQSN